MANLTCNLCGGDLIPGADGAPVCAQCGNTYAPVNAKNTTPKKKGLVIAAVVVALVLIGVVVFMVLKSHLNPNNIDPTDPLVQTSADSVSEFSTQSKAGEEATEQLSVGVPSVEAVKGVFLEYLRLEEYWLNEGNVMDRVKAGNRSTESPNSRDMLRMSVYESGVQTVQDLVALFRPYCTETYIQNRVKYFGYENIDGKLGFEREIGGYVSTDLIMESLRVEKESDTRFKITAFGEVFSDEPPPVKSDLIWVYAKQADGTWKVESCDEDLHNWEQEIKVVNTQNSDLRVRSETKINADNVVGSVPAGTEVIVLKSGYDWSYIMTKDGTLQGYAASEYLVYSYEIW